MDEIAERLRSERTVFATVHPDRSQVTKILTLGLRRPRKVPARWIPGETDGELLLVFREDHAMRAGVRMHAKVDLQEPITTGDAVHGARRVITGFHASGGQPEIVARTREAPPGR